jgi:hypothetical protein
MGGYILLRSNAGLCDSMFMLEMLTPYAKKYNRTIVWNLELYTASHLSSIFDLSNYPVNVLYGTKSIEDIKFSNIEPSCFGTNMYAIAKHHGPNMFSINDESAQFDITKEYPESTLLIYIGGTGGWVTMNNIRFNKKLIDEYYAKISELPEKFDAIHLRATDHFNQKLEKDLNEVRNFVKDKTKVYLATDNMKLMESLSEEFPQIIKSFAYKTDYKLQRSLHHDYGKIDPDLLKKAILDILICASSEEFLPSVGGFSRLIRHLHADKELLKKLTSTVELIRLDV